MLATDFHNRAPSVPSGSGTWDAFHEVIPSRTALIFLVVADGVISVPAESTVTTGISSVVNVIASVLASVLPRRSCLRFIVGSCYHRDINVALTPISRLSSCLPARRTRGKKDAGPWMNSMSSSGMAR